MREFFKPGDYLVICDRSGEKAFRSECVKEWNGLIVKREYAEQRHPLDLQRPQRKEWIPRDTRPPNDKEVAWGEVTRDDL